MDEHEGSARRRTLPPALTDERQIETVVRSFYGRVRDDAVLGPIFERAIGADWEPHLLKMFDFWSSVMLTSGRYKGQPMMVHMRLKTVRPEHFDHWLALFRTTVDEVCPGATADAFMERAMRIADSLRMGMFFNPADIDARARPAL